MARGDAAGAYRAGADVSASATHAGGWYQGRADRRRRRRAVSGLRSVQGDSGTGVLPAPAQIHAPAAAVRSPVPLFGRDRGVLEPFLPAGRISRRPALLSFAADPAHVAHQGLLCLGDAGRTGWVECGSRAARQPAAGVQALVPAQPRGIPRDGDPAIAIPPELAG